VAVDVASGKVRDLTPGAQVRAELLDALPEDPRHILVSHNGRDPALSDVYRIDVRTGVQTLVARNPGDVVAWQSDHAGRLRIGLRSDGLDFVLLYRDDDAGEFKPLITHDYKTEVEPQFFAADNRRFYALSNRGRDKKALVLIDPATPDREELVFAHPDVDLDRAHWSRKRHALRSVDYETTQPDHEFFDAPARRMHAALRAKLPGMALTLTSHDKEERKFVVAAANDRTPGARYLYDAETQALSKLADINPKIAEAAMAPLKPVSYKSRDGLVINAYLTLPPGQAPRQLACIVNPHGGPWSRDTWRYKAEVQFLANRGYCVLQMNFRGSTGYGRQFWEASFGQWGLSMQDDITDGVKWLVDQGIADPKRVGIYGGSYGGYATLMGITKTPELYAAAVDYCGVSNMFTFMDTIPPYWAPMLPKFHAMVGQPALAADQQRLRLTSPALQTDRIRTPLFVAQGARDPRVKKAESDQIVEALRKRGVQVQYMVKDNEGHGFRNEENQFEFYTEMEKFLAQHLKP
jgi:dipeptidyl aminopeptidase/acylaminoacyl peptidase